MIEIIPNWHPIFVHFTVALLSVSTGLFIILHLFSNRLSKDLQKQLKTVACWNLWIGSIITVITVAAGFYAYNTVDHDTPSHIVMTNHKNWALVTFVVFLCLAVWLKYIVNKSHSISSVFLICLIIASGLLASTAWRGGEVVYRYGLGVMSLPESGGDGHDHDHGSGDHHDAVPKTSNGMSEMDFSGLDDGFEDDGHDHQH